MAPSLPPDTHPIALDAHVSFEARKPSSPAGGPERASVWGRIPAPASPHQSSWAPPPWPAGTRGQGQDSGVAGPGPLGSCVPVHPCFQGGLGSQLAAGRLQSWGPGFTGRPSRLIGRPFSESARVCMTAGPKQGQVDLEEGRRQKTKRKARRLLTAFAGRPGDGQAAAGGAGQSATQSTGPKVHGGAVRTAAVRELGAPMSGWPVVTPAPRAALPAPARPREEVGTLTFSPLVPFRPRCRPPPVWTERASSQGPG